MEIKGAASMRRAAIEAGRSFPGYEEEVARIMGHIEERAAMGFTDVDYTHPSWKFVNVRMSTAVCDLLENRGYRVSRNAGGRVTEVSW